MLPSFRAIYEDYIASISPVDMALSWEALTAIDEILNEAQPMRIVEYGSGISTCLIASYCRTSGAGAASYDSDAEWAERTRKFLYKNELLNWISVSFLEAVQPAEPADFVLWDFDRNPKRVTMMPAAFENVASGGIMYVDDMQNGEICRSCRELGGVLFHEAFEDGFGRFGSFIIKN